MSRSQQTLKTPVEISGIGLHSGNEVHVRVLPAPVDHGIEFVRTDLEDAPMIPAHIRYYSLRERRTTLMREGVGVETIEHFLAACSGLEVDNLLVEMDGPEFPGVDGSAQPFVELLKKGVAIEQKQQVKVLILEEPVFVREGDATLVALPSDGANLSLQYVASFDDPEVQGGVFSMQLTPESFVEHLASARTFCLASEVEELQAAGLGKGATRENTVVLGDPDTVQRFPDEAVRHKLLDLVGDLSLLGAELKAQIIATKSGHSTNALLVERLSDVLQEQETGGLVERESGMDIREIIKMLPHRYPFLLIDRVIEVEGYKRAVAIKNVTINEPYFQGHFPERPLMPGVLQLEAMAQLAGMLLLRRLEYSGKLAVLWSLDKVKLRGGVTPGDQLRLEVETTRIKGETVQCRARGLVANKVVCEAMLMFTMIEA
jgi:UDP-3-O-[3-hydroxymyristoyl] N-acetylglucosamine deacetylase/3-hydroxyacyl-[acyl-carrier-protein] dehydratase